MLTAPALQNVIVFATSHKQCAETSAKFRVRSAVYYKMDSTDPQQNFSIRNTASVMVAACICVGTFLHVLFTPLPCMRTCAIL